MFSCKDEQKNNEHVAARIIDQNFTVLMDNISYFDMSKIPQNRGKSDSIAVHLYAGIGTMYLQEAISLFKEKFKLKQEKFEPLYFGITHIPMNSVDNYPINLVKEIPKPDNIVHIELLNCLMDQSGKFATITVVKNRGGGSKVEIYFFKQRNGKWIFDGKELLGLG
ncbi:hypothetical protein [Chryseobacterium sp. c4a]|uniref:hypothetical protein n=1 Tax=Chryseobacterium sp. c4a TaxID=1573582 RepID=UPI00135894DD|nr:hypothetical protein [Chryseobacterium sp. c4a]